MKTQSIQKCLIGLTAISFLSPLAAEPEKGAQSAARSVTVISHQDHYRDAWVGYSDGTVLYCLGGGESTDPTWASCAKAGKVPDSAVTAIAADGKFREAWVGFSNGALYRCKGGADLQTPWTNCNKAPVKVLEKK